MKNVDNINESKRTRNTKPIMRIAKIENLKKDDTDFFFDLLQNEIDEGEGNKLY